MKTKAEAIYVPENSVLSHNQLGRSQIAMVVAVSV